MIAEKLQEMGVQTLAVFATNAERARLYFRFRPPRVAVAADPDLITHRAYGLPHSGKTPEILQAIQTAAINLARELQPQVAAGQEYGMISQLDGFTLTESDSKESERHQAQLTGQFLVDRDGILRWANIECAREGLAGVAKFPTDDELLAAARTL